uniref:HECT domain-containing protein n=1 Tax=Cyclopterus lumpus TaxID=8103 RepID=A0A8C2Z204_CYCLU
MEITCICFGSSVAIKKENYIFNYHITLFKFLLLTICFIAEDQEQGDDNDGPHSITPARFLQWITGQGHIPLLPSEKKDFAFVIKFNHDCSADFGHHSVCYPVVSACAKTIVLPVRHMSSYDQFKKVLMEAFHLGQEFNNV